MAPTELKEQLQDLLNKEFIRPSTLPLGAPVLLVKEERWIHEIMHRLPTDK